MNQTLTAKFAMIAVLACAGAPGYAQTADLPSIFNRLNRTDLPNLAPFGAAFVPELVPTAINPANVASLSIQPDFGYSSNPDNAPAGRGAGFGLLDSKITEPLFDFPLKGEVSYQAFENNRSNDDNLIADLNWKPTYPIPTAPNNIGPWNASAGLEDKFADLDSAVRQNLAGITPAAIFKTQTVDLTGELIVQKVRTYVPGLPPASDSNGTRYTPQAMVNVYLNGNRASPGACTLEVDAGELFNAVHGASEVYRIQQLTVKATNLFLPPNGIGFGLDCSLLYQHEQYSHAQNANGDLLTTPSALWKLTAHYQPASWKQTRLLLNLGSGSQWGNDPMYAYHGCQIDVAVLHKFY